MKTATKKLIAKRHQAMNSAIASVRIEGLNPSSTAVKRMERYASGELSAQELRTQSIAAIFAVSRACE